MNESHSNQKLNWQYFHLGNHFLMSSCKSSIFQWLRQK